MKHIIICASFAFRVSLAYQKDYGRLGDGYQLRPDQLSSFFERGLATLDNLLTEAEVAELEVTYDKFMRREIHVPGKDFCDMSKPFDTPFEEYSIVNCMLPTRYHPSLEGNIYERLAAAIAVQLYPDTPMQKDYDQLLNKRPGKADAVFGWHQDMAYWPPASVTNDTRTVTFSLAIDSTNEANGCIRYLPGSGVQKQLRPHNPLGKDRDEAHAVQAAVGDHEPVALAPCPRGSATIHDEWVVHGSGGNNSPGDRRTYVVAFRTAATVAIERAAGFTHSHNDEVNWDSWDKIKLGAADAANGEL
jgi:hypothetical protein